MARSQANLQPPAPPLRFTVVVPSLVALFWKAAVKDLVLLRPFESFRSTNRPRGMSVWPDALDWVGGLPFEVARPDEVFNFYRARGFSQTRISTVGGGHGCNEFVFVKTPADATPGPTATSRGNRSS
jgi:2-polyprenyl-6-hydroxyphenyl methylase/3-demethylubiquinone-9 3-methyltransferase